MRRLGVFGRRLALGTASASVMGVGYLLAEKKAQEKEMPSKIPVVPAVLASKDVPDCNLIPPAGSRIEGLPTFRLSDLKKQGDRILVAYKEGVYDVTAFIEVSQIQYLVFFFK
jgi:hypothetical protein